MNIERSRNLFSTESLPLDMYAVSGHGEVRPEQYLKDKLQDQAIRNAVEPAPVRDVTSETFNTMFMSVTEEEQEGFILNTLAGPDSSMQMKALEKIRHFSSKESRISILRAALSQENPTIKKKAVESIRAVPEEARSEILEVALTQDDPMVQKAAAHLIGLASKGERERLIRTALLRSNVEAQIEAVGVIMSAPKEERKQLLLDVFESSHLELHLAAAQVWLPSEAKAVDLEERIVKDIQNAFLVPDSRAQIAVLKMIEYISKDRATDLIRKALTYGTSEVQIEAITHLKRVPRGNRADLLKIALISEDSAIWSKSASAIGLVSEDKREELQMLLGEKLESMLADVPAGQEEDIKAIKHLQEDRRIRLIKRVIAHPQASVRVVGVRLISEVPEGDRLELLRSVFKDSDDAVSITAAGMGWSLPAEEYQAFVQEIILQNDFPLLLSAIQGIREHAPGGKNNPALQGLLSKKVEADLASLNPSVQANALALIEFVPSEEQKRFIHMAFEQGLGETLIRPPLYENHPDIDDKQLRRQAFSKTGSGTTLLGGSLKDKLIVRHITPKAFLAWQKAYEDHKTWHANGFDYVPIEPIQSYHLNRNNLVDVYSGVLDLSLHRWSLLSGGLFMDELNVQKVKIESVLKDMGIEHGHMHLNNFVLRFFRDESNKPDLTRTPRLYAIDFDQAVSPDIQDLSL